MQLLISSEQHMHQLASKIAYLSEAGDTITLQGDLGVGKTVFAKGFINFFYKEPTDVPSPTFTLLQTYETPKGTIWHYDLYRLKNMEEAYELGIEDAFTDGISLIEWPEIIEELLPKNRLAITISYGDSENNRSIHIDAFGSWKNKVSTLV